MILKEMIRHESLAKILLYSPRCGIASRGVADRRRLFEFIEFIETQTFGIACDAQANFKDCLTRHKPMAAEYLETHYDEARRAVPMELTSRFFSRYAALVQSDNYVTKRQSLKMLGEILLDRTNFAVMTRYIASEDNLKMMMNLLRDKSKNIQFEAFHVFKVRERIVPV